MAVEGEFLIWGDVETTGTDSRECKLLEVAVLITDTDFNVVSDTPFHAVIRYSEDEVAAIYGQTCKVVQDMHTRTGLWSRLPEGTPLADVEAGLLEYLQRYVPQPKAGRLAGNSIRLDFNFLEEHLPSVARHLHHRTIDVSTVAALVEWANGRRVEKASNHTALTDILESIAELRILWGPLKEFLIDHPKVIAQRTPAASAVTT